MFAGTVFIYLPPWISSFSLCLFCFKEVEANEGKGERQTEVQRKFLKETKGAEFSEAEGSGHAQITLLTELFK